MGIYQTNNFMQLKNFIAASINGKSTAVFTPRRIKNSVYGIDPEAAAIREPSINRFVRNTRIVVIIIMGSR